VILNVWEPLHLNPQFVDIEIDALSCIKRCAEVTR